MKRTISLIILLLAILATAGAQTDSVWIAKAKQDIKDMRRIAYTATPPAPPTIQQWARTDAAIILLHLYSHYEKECRADSIYHDRKKELNDEALQMGLSPSARAWYVFCLNKEPHFFWTRPDPPTFEGFIRWLRRQQ